MDEVGPTAGDQAGDAGLGIEPDLDWLCVVSDPLIIWHIYRVAFWIAVDLLLSGYDFP